MSDEIMERTKKALLAKIHELKDLSLWGLTEGEKLELVSAQKAYNKIVAEEEK